MIITSSAHLREEFELRAAIADLKIECAMSGSYLSQIAIISEAPGASEVAQGQPLVGPSGRMLWTAMRDYAKVSRNDCYTTNVCKRQVAFEADVMRKPIGKHELTSWQELLRWELEQLPALKYVVVSGNYALEAVTGKTGILKWRGSVLTAQIGERTVQVICIVNPAMMLRDPKLQITFNMDCSKFKRVLDGKWREHVINTYINPSMHEVMDFLAEMKYSKTPVSSDIEVIHGETACIGFANSAHTAMCIPFRDMDSNLWSGDDELTIRRAISDVYNNPQTRLIMQNGHFDCSWLMFKDRIRVQPLYFDTMLAHHTLYPTMPHNLGFLCTQYTDHPYYKDEKDDWRTIGGVDDFWRYNAKDCAITWSIHQELLSELRDQNMYKFFIEHVMRLQPHLIQMTINGIKVDVNLKEKIKAELEITLEQRLAKFHEAVVSATGEQDYRPSPRSPKQLSELFFSKLRLVGRGVSTDAQNRDVMFKHPRTSEPARRVIVALNEYAKDAKFYSTYADSRNDEDGRMRTEYKQIGVQNAPGRLSSGQTLWGSGTNLQNQPDRAKVMYIADEGYCFVYIDGSQAEARVVGWKAPVPNWIDQFERARLEGGYDAHNALAADMFGVPYDDVPTFDRYDTSQGHPPPVGFNEGDVTIRFTAKRCRHGLNYRMQADKLAITTGLPIDYCMNAYRLYHKINPEIKRWWLNTELEVKKTRMLFNAYGRRYIQLEPPTPETMDSIIAFYPQSTIGDMLCRVIYKCHDDPKWPKHAKIVLNIHDALIAIARIGEDAKQALRIMIKHAEEPLMVGGKPLIIPADAAMSVPDEHGVHRWSTIKKLKKQELYK